MQHFLQLLIKMTYMTYISVYMYLPYVFVFTVKIQGNLLSAHWILKQGLNVVFISKQLPFISLRSKKLWIVSALFVFLLWHYNRDFKGQCPHSTQKRMGMGCWCVCSALLLLMPKESTGPRAYEEREVMLIKLIWVLLINLKVAGW